MNKEYTYIDGKVIISDENNKKVQSVYYDNLDKVLAQENLIETMEAKIQELETESKSYKKNNRGHFFPIITPIAIFMLTVILPLFLWWITESNPFTEQVQTIMGQMSLAMSFSISMSIAIIPISLLADVSTYISYKSSIKNEKGINSELDFLKKQIEKERETLDSLKQDRSRANESTEFRTITVDDSKEIESLKSLLNIYFDLGYNIESYYHLYKLGQLEEKLKKYYNKAGIQLAKEYLEEKGPTLVRKKKDKTDNQEK